MDQCNQYLWAASADGMMQASGRKQGGHGFSLEAACSEAQRRAMLRLSDTGIHVAQQQKQQLAAAIMGMQSPLNSSSSCSSMLEPSRGHVVRSNPGQPGARLAQALQFKQLELQARESHGMASSSASTTVDNLFSSNLSSLSNYSGLFDSNSTPSMANPSSVSGTYMSIPIASPHVQQQNNSNSFAASLSPLQAEGAVPRVPQPAAAFAPPPPPQQQQQQQQMGARPTSTGLGHDFILVSSRPVAFGVRSQLRVNRQSLLTLLGAVPASGAPITFQVARAGVILPEVYTGEMMVSTKGQGYVRNMDANARTAIMGGFFIGIAWKEVNGFQPQPVATNEENAKVLMSSHTLLFIFENDESALDGLEAFPGPLVPFKQLEVMRSQAASSAAAVQALAMSSLASLSNDLASLGNDLASSAAGIGGGQPMALPSMQSVYAALGAAAAGPSQGAVKEEPGMGAAALVPCPRQGAAPKRTNAQDHLAMTQGPLSEGNPCVRRRSVELHAGAHAGTLQKCISHPPTSSVFGAAAAACPEHAWQQQQLGAGHSVQLAAAAASALNGLGTAAAAAPIPAPIPQWGNAGAMPHFQGLLPDALDAVAPGPMHDGSAMAAQQHQNQHLPRAQEPQQLPLPRAVQWLQAEAGAGAGAGYGSACLSRDLAEARGSFASSAGMRISTVNSDTLHKILAEMAMEGVEEDDPIMDCLMLN